MSENVKRVAQFVRSVANHFLYANYKGEVSYNNFERARITP